MQIHRSGVVVPVRPDPTGRAGPTPKQVRGKRWRRTSPGLYVPATTDSTAADQRIVEAAAGLPAGAGVTGWAALHWVGVPWFEGVEPDGMTPLPVPVALHDRRTIAHRPGVRRSEDWLFADDLIEYGGIVVTRPERSVTFETRRARRLIRAVQIVDMALASDVVDLDELHSYIARLPARAGIRLTRAAAAFGNENVWSPQEATMRVVWCTDGGRPAPWCNVPIFDLAGHHLLTPDLFDPRAGVAGEYNGAVHDSWPVRRRDLEREELYREHGIEFVTMMSTDLCGVTAFVRRLDAAYRRASRHHAHRTWTLDQPTWWVDTSTVALRRALDAERRARWLRRRGG